MKRKSSHSLFVAAMTLAGIVFSASSASAAALIWDITPGDGASITAGSGSWNLTAGNTVWNNAGTNAIWGHTSTTDGSNTATFAGADGTLNQYVVTLGAQMAAESITFNSSGYQITGSTLALMPTTTTSGPITVAAGKTATINSILRYAHNTAASVVVGSGGVLNLGGGTTAANNPQFAFTGAGTVNITAGTYASNIGSIGNATFNQTGGTYNITPGNGAGFNITSTTQNVAYNLSAGTLSVNGNATTANGVSNAHLGIGNGTSTFTSTLAVSGAGIMNVGTTAGTYGEIRVGNAIASNGTFQVTGGTVTVGTGAVGNKIYFFKNGSSAGFTASMTQSAGTVTTNGIQFGSSTGTYDAGSAANLTLSGGSLYVGDRGIIRGSGTAAESLPVTIKLQGGTLGADQNWSSSMDMKLGAATIRAQDAASNSRNISLSGVLSDDSTAGTLTKTGSGILTISGANSYTGATTINEGTLALGASNVLPNASAVSVGGAALDAVTFTDTTGTLDVTGSATINLGLGATLAFADSSSVDWVGGTLTVTGTFVPGSSLRFGTTNGGLTASQLASISISGYSNFILDELGYLTVGDSTPPILTSIVDNKSAGPIAADTTVTYTVTFNEPMNVATVNAEDFDNAGTAGYSIGAIASVSSTVFTVQVTNTTPGSLILQIPATATITDAVGNALARVPAPVDDTTITVNSSPAPVLLVSNMVDDKAGQPVAPGMVVTYTLTFSEDMDALTLGAEDLSNAGTALVDMGAITEISPGVFTVQVTPIGTGTLRLMVNADAEIRAASSGNVLNTSVAIQDADTITVGNYLFWDTVAADGFVFTPGSGNWDLLSQNAVWNNVTSNVSWSQSGTTDGSNAAIFAGVDGALNQYVITLGAQMATESITFHSSGYQITGSTLALMPTTSTNGSITVAAAKSATINSAIAYANNKVANITANLGATLSLGGGASNSQYQFLGAGTINLTGGTYTANVGKMNAATFNQSGGTFNMNLPTVGDGHYIGYDAGRSVSFTLDGNAIINANASVDASVNSFLAIGRAAGSAAFTNSLNVQGNANLNIGNAANRAGELLIAFDTISNGTLNVSSGAVTVGTGKTSNQIYFFKAGSGSGYAAAMTQSGGTVITNGIQFGGTAGTYNLASAASLTLGGGNLYVGAAGITRGSAASDLPISIKLQGGILGANQNWISGLDMRLGAATVRAQDAATTARNITLSGVLSDDSGAGSLTKTGTGVLTLSGVSANTYTGATIVNAGTLNLGKVNAVSSSSSLTIANGAALALSTSSASVPSLTFQGTGTLSFNVADGHVLTVDQTDGVTNSGAAGSVTINISGSAPASGTYSLIDYTGSLQGTGFSAYALGSVPAGKSYALANDTVNGAIQLVVTSNYTWTGATGSEWSTATIAGSKNWTKDGSAIDYMNDLGVIFDSTAISYIVDISGADVTPLSVAFNSGTYTLQGTHTIAGSGAVTIHSGATLKLGSSDKLPNGVGAGNVALNGTLDLNGFSDTINALTGSGIVDNTASATTSTLTIGANAGGNFAGSLTNTIGTLALTKIGNTDVTLSGSNTYGGATTISQGRLFIGAASAFSPNTAVVVSNGASLVLNAGSSPAFARSIALTSGSNVSMRQTATISNVTLPSSGNVKFNFDEAATQAFSITTAQALAGSLDVQVGGSNASVGNVTLNAIISGSEGSLIKSGPGRLIIRGANTYGGGVAIKNGTLESQNTTTTLGSGTVTLGGTGSTGATFLTGQNNANPFVINAPDSGNLVIGTNGGGSVFTMSGGITLNGNLTLQTFENVVSGSTVARTIVSGNVAGTGNLLLNNLGLAANTISLSGSSVNHAGSITLQGTASGNVTISAAIGSNVTAITQNSATSPLVLSGANTYQGNLVVNAGIVRISNAPDPLNANTGNDASTVTIAETGATLDLTYTGTDKVDKLVIGSTQQANGVYGKVGSASPVIGIPQITGDGTLTVGTVTPSGFSSWITGTFANGTVSLERQGPNDDFDKDGISNLLEYAIAGQDPTVSNTSISSFSANTISFTKREGTSGISYDIEISTLLTAESWTTLAKPPVVESPSVISYTFTPGTPEKQFARLKVTQAP